LLFSFKTLGFLFLLLDTQRGRAQSECAQHG
jgi:hypothetical protein